MRTAPDPLPARGRSATVEIDAAQQARMVAALCQTLGSADRKTELIETHLSFVLLAGGLAIKIRKAVSLGFVDFSTMAQRRADCEEELRLNRRSAPQLYLDIVPVTGSLAQPLLGGSGPAIDWAVRMRAFAQDGLWSRLAAQGQLWSAQIDALVDSLCAFHRDAATERGGGRFGSAAQVRAPMRDTLRALDRLCTANDERAWRSLLSHWEAQAGDRLHRVFDERQRSGHVRECHGDLHLGNVTQIDGRPTMFDALEFDPVLRWIDVMNDVAFMAMDLHAHGLHPLAHRFVDAYVTRSGDADGLRVLRYYTVYLALVRAKVASMPGAAGGADGGALRHRYLSLALALRRPLKPVLMLTHGVSGSGKTLFTQSLLELCGAIRFRADIERKRLFGLEPLATSSPEQKQRLYAPAATTATYTRLREQAELALAAGYPVILDATFLDAEARRLARVLAEAAGAAFVIIDFEASEATLRARVQRRSEKADDASEADLAVLDAQLARRELLGEDERDAVWIFDAEPPFEAGAAAERWAPLLQRLGRQLSVGPNHFEGLSS